MTRKNRYDSPAALVRRFAAALFTLLFLIACAQEIEPPVNNAQNYVEIPTGEVEDGNPDVPDADFPEENDPIRTAPPTTEPTLVPTAPPEPTPTEPPPPILEAVGNLNAIQERVFNELTKLEYTHPANVHQHTEESVMIVMSRGGIDYQGETYNGIQYVRISDVPGHEGELIFASAEGVKAILGIDTDTIGIDPETGRFTASFEGKLVARENEDGRWEVAEAGAQYEDTPEGLAILTAGYDPEKGLKFYDPKLTGIENWHVFIMHTVSQFGEANPKFVDGFELKIDDAEKYNNAIQQVIKGINEQGLFVVIDGDRLDEYNIAKDEGGNLKVYRGPGGVVMAHVMPSEDGTKLVHEIATVMSPGQSKGFTGTEQTMWRTYGGSVTPHLSPEGNLVVHFHYNWFGSFFRGGANERFLPYILEGATFYPLLDPEIAWDQYVIEQDNFAGDYDVNNGTEENPILNLFNENLYGLSIRAYRTISAEQFRESRTISGLVELEDQK